MTETEAPPQLAARLQQWGATRVFGYAGDGINALLGAMQRADGPEYVPTRHEELITVADRWRDWADPRFVVLVLHNSDLSEVSWEQREMENNPRFATSQAVPPFPYAGYAEMLGLGAVRITESAQAPDAWAQAFAGDWPFLIEAMTDPSTPLLPPLMPDAKVERMYDAIDQEDGGDAIRDRVRRQRAEDA